MNRQDPFAIGKIDKNLKGTKKEATRERRQLLPLPAPPPVLQDTGIGN